MYFLDKYGYPVERVKGRWGLNIIRLLIHTRKISRRCENIEQQEDKDLQRRWEAIMKDCDVKEVKRVK